MKKYFIITNAVKDPEFEITYKIETFLVERGCSCSRSIYMPQKENHRYRYTNPDAVPEDIQCILVIGGDGTLIHAAKDLCDRGIPLLGINFGKLGYLAEVEKNNIEASLEKLIQGDYHLEQRIMLSGKLIRAGRVIEENIALNDIVINRCGSLRIIDFIINVNGQLLNHYSADGIIISTPTGATGYNLSAGGPIAQPSANIILVTPICAHTLNSRSIVFSGDVKIEIEISTDKNHNEGGKILAFDGDNEIELKTYDKILIEKAETSTEIIKINAMSFLELLGKKMC